MPGPGSVGNVSQVQPAPVKGPWPPIVAGKEIWRSAVLGDHERPWFWRCPFCMTWIRGTDPNELKNFAGSHIGTVHK